MTHIKSDVGINVRGLLPSLVVGQEEVGTYFCFGFGEPIPWGLQINCAAYSGAFPKG